MSEFISKNKKWLGYTLYGILITAALLYYRFPEDVLRDYIQSRVNRMDSRFALSIERVRPWPALSLKFTGTKITLKEKPQRDLIKADDLVIRPNVWSLLKADKEFWFDGTAYRGDLEGSITLVKGDGPGPFRTKIKCRDIDLGDNANIKALFGRSVKGILSGDITYSGPFNPLAGGAGEAKIRLAKGQLYFAQPFLGLEAIDFNDMKIEMNLKKNIINLATLEFSGREMTGSLTGRINLRNDFNKSSLFLKGKIKIFPGAFEDSKNFRNALKLVSKRLRDGGLSFTIRGTIKKPKIRFT